MAAVTVAGVVPALLVAVGGAVGAPLRYLVDRWVRLRLAVVLPLGTLLVNVAGSLLLGLLTGLAVGHTAMALLGVGLCGALTTYSTLGHETVRLLAAKEHKHAVVSTLANLVAGVGAAVLGVLTGVLLAG